MEVKLRKDFFGEKERLFFKGDGGIGVCLFTCDTGERAVKPEN